MPLNPSAAPQIKVLVSGAGIAGTCFAYWLARTRLNVAIKVVERSPSPRVTGQSIDIRGPAIDIVKRMNLEEKVRERHTTETGTRFLNSAGKPFAEFIAGDTFTAEYEILRADLSGLFLDAARQFDNVEFVYGDHVKSLEQNEKNVRATFHYGPEETFDVVVGADGSMSKTRALIMNEQQLEGSYQFIGQYTAFFSIPRQNADDKMWYWYNAPNGRGLMIRPHRNDTTMGAYICITTPSRGTRDPLVEKAMDEGTEATKRMLHRYFQDAGWQTKRILSGMDQSDDFYMSRAALVKLPKWTADRAVLLGDAAHATFGVGTTLAILGSYLLAGELSKIQKSSDIPRALEAFEEIFRGIQGTMDELPPGFPQIAFPQTRAGLWLRDLLLWIVSKTQAYKLLPASSEKKYNIPHYEWKDT